MVEIELPYLRFGDEFLIIYEAHNIDHLNEDKRIRVFGGQLTDTIVEGTKLSNFNWNIGIFFKFGNKLIRKYPHREVELNQIMMDFWRRMQIRYKELKENHK